MNPNFYFFLRMTPLLVGSVLVFSVFFSSTKGTRENVNIQADLIDFEVTREPRIGSARIASVTGQDAAITISANTVRSRSLITEANPISLDLLYPVGDVQFPAGDMVWFSGNSGKIDEVGDSIRLEGSVKVWTADGYTARMDYLNSNLQSTYIIGTGDVEGLGPFGTVFSNKLEIFPDSFDKSSYFLKFSGDVFVTYLPEE